MIEIKKQPIKNLISEMTVEEFQKCTNIMSDDDKEYVERYMEIMSVLGASDDLITSLDIDTLCDFVKVFAKDMPEENTIPHKIEVEGVVYKIYEGAEYKMPIKDVWQIEKSIKREGRFNFGKALAIICKEEGLSHDQYYTDITLLNKEEIFSRQNITKFLPLIHYVITQLGVKVKILLQNEASL